MSERRVGPPLHDRLGAMVRERLPTPHPGRPPSWLAAGARPRIGPMAAGLLVLAALGLTLVAWPAASRRLSGRARPAGSLAPRPAQLDHDACVRTPLGPTGVDVTARAADQPWVHTGTDGRLEYREDERGNRVPDFSSVGYHGGEVEPPLVAAAAAPLSPGQPDDAAAIQAAIDAVAARTPDARGFRGAVELATGTFVLRAPLRITASGIVLRGQGAGAAATILRAVGQRHPAIVVGVPGTLARFRTSHAVADTLAPVGSRALTLADATGLSPGHEIVIERPSTRAWACALGMDTFEARADGVAPKPWQEGTELRMFRRIVAVDGNRITLDAPLPAALESAYTAAVVRRYRLPERISEVGVEALAIEAAFTGTPAGEDALLDVGAVDDGWLRRVRVSAEVPIAVRLGRFARRITVTDSAVAGVSRGVAFQLSGQLVLMRRLRVEGDQLRALMTTASTAGPNAAVDLTVVGEDVAVETQRRWAVGLLLDGVRLTDAAGRPSGVISIANQGNRGTGHGWSAANSMVWNSSARWMVVDSPPTAANWVTGGKAAALFGTGSFSEVGAPASPPSLYQAQRAERLGR